MPGRKRGETLEVSQDEHLRPDTSAEALPRLKPIFRQAGTVIAGNASGINDGAVALLLAPGEQVRKLGLTPRARAWFR